MELANRRPLKTRSAVWPHQLARVLANAGFSANGVSVLGLVFALLGSAALFGTLRVAGGGRATLLVLAAVCVQLRLLCNLLDGLIAVENHRRSKVGELYNEVPDRLADAALLVAIGYASRNSFGPTLGWSAAVLAVGTAYVRMLGASLLGTHDFSGPFAKPQRMATLTLGALAGAGETLSVGTSWALLATVTLLAAGTGVTVLRRLYRLAGALNAR